MSHTGVYEVGSRRAARNSDGSGGDTPQSLSEGSRRRRSDGLPESRSYMLREALHRGEHALVGNERADVHPDGELREADRRAQLFEPVDDALGRAVDGEVLQHFFEAHALEPVAGRLARPGQERLADRAVEAQGTRLGFLDRKSVV